MMMLVNCILYTLLTNTFLCADEAPSPRLFELRDELIWIGVMRKFISPLFTMWQLAWPETFKSDFNKYITI